MEGSDLWARLLGGNRDVQVLVFRHVGLRERVLCMLVCRSWKLLLQESSGLWFECGLSCNYAGLRLLVGELYYGALGNTLRASLQPGRYIPVPWLLEVQSCWQRMKLGGAVSASDVVADHVDAELAALYRVQTGRVHTFAQSGYIFILSRSSARWR
jgi:hypothetical protein